MLSWFSISTAIPAIFVLWGAAILWWLINKGKFQYRSFKFSVDKYYLLVVPLLVPFVVEAYITQSFEPFIYMIVFGAAGIVGETAFSIWWQTFYSKKFWTYKVKPRLHAYTSFVNFGPYALGGAIYVAIAQYFYPLFEMSNVEFSAGDFYSLFVILAGVVYLWQMLTFSVVFRFKNKNYKFKEVGRGNFLFFLLVVIVPIAVLSALYGLGVLWMVVVFGALIGALEYWLGRGIQFFITKQAWTYDYLSLDKGHFTFLSLPFFAAGGLYFGAIATLVSSFL